MHRFYHIVHKVGQVYHLADLFDSRKESCMCFRRDEERAFRFDLLTVLFFRQQAEYILPWWSLVIRVDKGCLLTNWRNLSGKMAWTGSFGHRRDVEITIDHCWKQSPQWQRNSGRTVRGKIKRQKISWLILRIFHIHWRFSTLSQVA